MKPLHKKSKNRTMKIKREKETISMTRARSNAVSGTSAPFVGSQRSSGPARAPMIGAHKQQQQDPAFDMQQAIGNQATQQAMAGYVSPIKSEVSRIPTSQGDEANTNGR
jgi:hypothetical protein